MKKLTLFCLLGVLFITCNLNYKNGKGKNNRQGLDVLTHLWNIDSCGRLHMRENIYEYLFIENDYSIVGEKEILNLFPHPNRVIIDTVKNEIIYNYIIEGYSGCGYPNEGVLKSMYIKVDRMTKKVKYSSWSIH